MFRAFAMNVALAAMVMSGAVLAQEKLGCAAPDAQPAAAASADTAATTDAPRVLFKITTAGDAPTILRFVTNYLAAEPTARVAVVGYGGGVDFMLKDAVDANGKLYEEQLAALAAKGVSFKVCNNTLKARSLTADAVSPSAAVVPGAVNEIIRLQTKEHYAYFQH